MHTRPTTGRYMLSKGRILLILLLSCLVVNSALALPAAYPTSRPTQPLSQTAAQDPLMECLPIDGSPWLAACNACPKELAFPGGGTCRQCMQKCIDKAKGVEYGKAFSACGVLCTTLGKAGCGGLWKTCFQMPAPWQKNSCMLMYNTLCVGE
jgi:hypothetical protein